MKRWEIIADNLSAAGWSWGCVSALDSEGHTIWVADAHRGDGKRAPSRRLPFVIVYMAFSNLFGLLEKKLFSFLECWLDHCRFKNVK
jgi:hypothetical protein